MSLEEELFGDLKRIVEADLKKLQGLTVEADKIMREELSRSGFSYDFAEVRILNARTVGVQGDGRTYAYPAVIDIRYKGSLVWDEGFIRRLSDRITNEVKDINRVTYSIESK